MNGLVALMTIHVMAKRETGRHLLALLIAFAGAVGASFGMVVLARHVAHDSRSMFGVLVGVGTGAAFAVMYLIARGALGPAPRR